MESKYHNIKSLSFLLFFILINSFSIVISFKIDNDKGPTLPNPFESIYNSLKDLKSKYKHLVSQCTKSKVEEFTSYNDDKSESIIYYKISSDTANKNTPKKKVLLQFGIHAREIITSEVGLFISESLCRNNEYFSEDVINKLLEYNDFYIIPIANEPGRVILEKNKNYCQRKNENGIDLNRNFDNHRELIDNFIQNSDTYPGKKALSEWESRVLLNIYKEIKPDVFIDFHSGELGIYTPFGRKKLKTDEKFNKEIDELISLIKPINEKFCKCNYGEIGKNQSGSALDYLFENLNVKYSFAFEIFSNENDKFTNYYNKLVSKKETISKLDFNIKAIEVKTNKNFLQINTNSMDSNETKNKKSNINENKENESYFSIEDMKECLVMFNPMNKEEVQLTEKLWASITFQLINSINSSSK